MGVTENQERKQAFDLVRLVRKILNCLQFYFEESMK